MDRLDGIFEIIDKIKFGEIVLLEHGSSFVPELGVLLLLKYARVKNLPVVIDDNLDTLFLIKSHLEFFGIKEEFKDCHVIKTGGFLNVGNVVGRIHLATEPSIYVKKYKKMGFEMFDRLQNSINIVLGIERFLHLLESPSEFYYMISALQSFLGNTKRKSFYFFDKDVGETSIINPLPELRRIASTVIEIHTHGSAASLTIKKAAAPSLLGKSVAVDITDVLGE